MHLPCRLSTVTRNPPQTDASPPGLQPLHVHRITAKRRPSTTSYFRAFSFAHLAFCAAAMLARPAALILRVGFLT